MTLDDIFKTIVGGVIAYYLPKILKATDITETHVPWLSWTIGSFTGAAIGGIASALMGDKGFGNWAIFGACLGIGQLLALQGYLSVKGWWAVASTVGWALYPIGGISAPVLVGACVGILQAISLGNTGGKGWWILGNIIVWPIVTLIGMMIVGPLFAAVGPVFGWIIGWGLVGLIGSILLLFPLGKLK